MSLRQVDARGDTVLKRWAQDRDRDPAREALGVGVRDRCGLSGGRLWGGLGGRLWRGPLRPAGVGSAAGAGWAPRAARRFRRRRCLLRSALAHKPDDVIDRRVIAQLHRIITLDPILLPDRREHLSLLDRIDPQISLEIQIHIEQLRRITRLLGHNRQHPLLDLIERSRGRRHGRRHGSGAGAGPPRPAPARALRPAWVPPPAPPAAERARAQTRRHD